MPSGRRLWLLSCGSGLRRRGDIVGSVGEVLRRIRLGQIIEHWGDLRAPGV